LNIVRKRRKKIPQKIFKKNSVSDPYSFDTDPDPAFQAEYRTGSGSNPDPGFYF
jgi:hypothetical protein